MNLRQTNDNQTKIDLSDQEIRKLLVPNQYSFDIDTANMELHNIESLLDNGNSSLEQNLYHLNCSLKQYGDFIFNRIVKEHEFAGAEGFTYSDGKSRVTLRYDSLKALISRYHRLAVSLTNHINSLDNCYESKSKLLVLNFIYLQNVIYLNKLLEKSISKTSETFGADQANFELELYRTTLLMLFMYQHQINICETPDKLESIFNERNVFDEIDIRLHQIKYYLSIPKELPINKDEHASFCVHYFLLKAIYLLEIDSVEDAALCYEKAVRLCKSIKNEVYLNQLQTNLYLDKFILLNESKMGKKENESINTIDTKNNMNESNEIEDITYINTNLSDNYINTINTDNFVVDKSEKIRNEIAKGKERINASIHYERPVTDNHSFNQSYTIRTLRSVSARESRFNFFHLALPSRDGLKHEVSNEVYDQAAEMIKDPLKAIANFTLKNHKVSKLKVSSDHGDVRFYAHTHKSHKDDERNQHYNITFDTEKPKRMKKIF